MSGAAAGLRRIYGSSGLHLLTMLAGFALLAYLIVTAGPATLWTPAGSWWRSMAVWFAAAIVFHDLVLFPLYALSDRLLALPDRLRHNPSGVRAGNYLRVPALGSGLLLLVFFPDIVRQGAPLYHADTGLTQEPFLGRWLMLTAILFTVSAVCFALRLGWAQRTRNRRR